MLYFFFNDPATTEIYTLSLHDALPICHAGPGEDRALAKDRLTRPVLRFGEPGLWSGRACPALGATDAATRSMRSEEHTSELQSRQYLVCRLLLPKKHLTTSSLQNTRKI